MKRLTAIAALLALSVGAASAQELKSAYFLEGYVYGYHLNPAAPIDGKPFTFFGTTISHVAANVQTNIGLNSVFFPLDGALVSGFDERIPAEKFIDPLPDISRMIVGANENLLTFGRQGEKSRFAFEVNVRTDNYAEVPKGFFSMMKTGLTEGIQSKTGSYTFNDLYFNSGSRAEIALSYARKIGDKFTVGATLKGLIGLHYAVVGFNSMTLSKGADKDLAASLDGYLKVATPMIGLNTISYGGKKYFDNTSNPLTTHPFGISGFGFAGDLGVTFEPVDGLTLSLSALDLGFMSWNANIVGRMNYDSRELDIKEYEQLAWIEALDAEKLNTSLNYTIHAGAKYKMPFYDRLSVGLLGTMQKYYKEMRLGVNVNPVNPLSLTASFAYGSFGADFGGALNVRFPGVNLYIGMDSFIFEFTPQYVPIKRVNTTVNMGLVIAI
ncbi:MAG: hypothetical protein IJS66_02155 [Bacteroidales bacterium]|nr:hypothetical protein [Bacteroidales bacterium]